MPRQITVSQWLSLDPRVRAKLKEIFSIPRSSGSHVEYQAAGSMVVSDGHTNADLANITIEKMQALLDSDSTDFYDLFDQVISTIELQVVESAQKSASAPVAPRIEVTVKMPDGETLVGDAPMPDVAMGGYANTDASEDSANVVPETTGETIESLNKVDNATTEKPSEDKGAANEGARTKVRRKKAA